LQGLVGGQGHQPNHQHHHGQHSAQDSLQCRTHQTTPFVGQRTGETNAVLERIHRGAGSQRTTLRASRTVSRQGGASRSSWDLGTSAWDRRTGKLTIRTSNRVAWAGFSRWATMLEIPFSVTHVEKRYSFPLPAATRVSRSCWYGCTQ